MRNPLKRKRKSKSLRSQLLLSNISKSPQQSLSLKLKKQLKPKNLRLLKVWLSLAKNKAAKKAAAKAAEEAKKKEDKEDEFVSDEDEEIDIDNI
jgi:hypothetical protein